MIKKICSRCGLEKLIDEFAWDNKEQQIKRANCKACKNTISKELYENTREDPLSVAKRIIKHCKEREKERLSKFIKKRDNLSCLPDVELAIEQFNLDTDWILEQRFIQNNKCFYTNIELAWSTGLIDNNRRMNPYAVTVDRVDSFKGYTKDNCVLACWWANCSKGTGTYEELVKFACETLKKFLIDSVK